LGVDYRQNEALENLKPLPSQPQERKDTPVDHFSPACDIPAWQRDSGHVDRLAQAAQQERQNLLQALTLLGRHGVLLSRDRRVFSGTNGWRSHIQVLKTFSFDHDVIGCAARASEREFVDAIALVLDKANIGDIPLALRDLDGWVQHLAQLRRVGFFNPDLVLVLLPRSADDICVKISELALPLGLTRLETDLLKCMMSGQSDSEAATHLHVPKGSLKAASLALNAKFRVRQKSDIVRLLSASL
jgi:hypothetical protein